MKWYDFFSNFYDSSLEKLYFGSRKRAIELLDLNAGDILLDVACGTGANFSHIKYSNDAVDLYGTDFSNGMLSKAQALIKKNNWKNIYLFQSDAREINSQTIDQLLKKQVKFNKVICVLGLSVIPEWEKVLDNLINLLEPNGRIVIVDVYAEERSFNTWLVERIAKADLDRKIYQTLETKVAEFKYESLPVKERKVGGKLFVATGLKK